MPSAQDYAQRLREQAYQTLTPQVSGLEQDFQNLSGLLSTGLNQIGGKLEALRNIELPTIELVLTEIFDELLRHKDLEMNSLAAYARDIRRKETQEEILASLLDNAAKCSSHVALFAVRADRFVGWSSRGYSDDVAQKIGSCSLPLSECQPIKEALEGEQLVSFLEFSGEYANLEFLRGKAEGPWHIMPMKAMRRPVALLVAAGAKDSPCRLDPLSVLVEIAMLRIENLALRILYELTTSKSQLTPETPGVAAFVKAEASPAASVPAVVQTDQPGRSVEAPAEPEESARAAAEAAGLEMSAPAEETPPPPVAPASETAVSEAAEPREDRHVGEDERLYADAKRFARLLVSEIRLYNEHHVREGRENRDLYLRLKRDIDRSREMYEKRVSPIVARKIDYFHDEIIRILGDNDPSTLGSDYPGPRVES